MRLELRQTEGPQNGRAKRGWTLERGRRTLGNGRDCDWPVADDNPDLSDHLCVVARDRDGFYLEDLSAYGTRVDNTVLRQGERSRLAHGSSIAFGEVSFKASIFGEPEPEVEDPKSDLSLSEDAPTVSAILADVAPEGRHASGLSGNPFSSEDLSASWPQRSGETKSRGPSSRNVEIGWSGPPDIEGSRTTLPVDWNEDPGAASFASDIEHRSAMTTSVPHMTSPSRTAQEPVDDIPDHLLDGLASYDERDDAKQTGQAGQPEEAPSFGQREQGGDLRSDGAKEQDVFGTAEDFDDIAPGVKDAPVSPAAEERSLSSKRATAPAAPERDDDPESGSGPFEGPSVTDILAAPRPQFEPAPRESAPQGPDSASTLHRTQSETAPTASPSQATLPIEPSDEGSVAAAPRLDSLMRDAEEVLDETGELLGLSDTAKRTTKAGGDTPEQRLATIVERQLAQREALSRLFREASRSFEPRLIEARCDTGLKRFDFLMKPLRRWAVYRSQFRKNGRDLSVHELLLSRMSGADGTADGEDANSEEQTMTRMPRSS